MSECPKADRMERNARLCRVFGWFFLGVGVLAIALWFRTPSGCADRPVLQLLNEQAGYSCAGSRDRPLLRLLNEQGGY
jgi:hypothetical protein